jgi:hypothetical protein
MEITLTKSVSYLFGGGSILATLVVGWVGAMAIRAGTLVGGSTLLFVGILFLFAGVLVLPPSRRKLRSRFGIGLSGLQTVLLSGGAVTLAVFLLFAAFVALLASGQ